MLQMSWVHLKITVWQRINQSEPRSHQAILSLCFICAKQHNNLRTVLRGELICIALFSVQSSYPSFSIHVLILRKSKQGFSVLILQKLLKLSVVHQTRHVVLQKELSIHQSFHLVDKNPDIILMLLQVTLKRYSVTI